MSETSATPLNNNNPKPARRRRKWLIASGVVVLLFLLVVVFVALLPTLLTGGFMQGTLHGLADDAVQGKITWSKLDVKWGKGQRIEDLVVADAQGNAILTLAKVDAPDVSLWSIVWGHKNMGTITAVLDSAHITQQADGEYNIAKALSPTPSNKPSSPKQNTTSKPTEPLSGWKAAVVFQGSDIQITPLDAPAVTVKTINLSGDLQNPAATIALTFDTAIEQNKQQAGQAQGTLTLNNLMDAQGNLQLAKATVDAQIALNELPWSLMAAVSQQDPKLGSLIGEKISAQLKMQGNLLAPKGQLQITSSQIKTDVKIASTIDALIIEPGSSFALDINAQGWKTWAADSQTQLLAPVQLRAQINELILPKLKNKTTADPIADAIQFDLAALKASVDLSVSDLKLQSSDAMGQLSLTGTKAAMRSEQLGKKISLTFEADASRNNQSGNLRMTATASDLADAQGQLGLSRVNAEVQATASHLPLEVLDQVLGLGNKLAGVLGPELDAKAVATIKPSAEGGTATGPFEVTMSSSQFNMKLSGLLSAQALSLDAASTAVLTVTPTSAVAAGLPADTLLSPVQIQWAIQQVTIPRTEQGLLIDQGKINTTFTASTLTLAGAGEVKQLGVNGLKLSVASEAIGKLISIDAQATTQADAMRGSLTASVQVAHLMQDSAQAVKQAAPMSITFDVATKDLPLAAADALAGQKDVLTLWLGPVLNVQASGTMESDAQGVLQGSVALKANSQQLKVDTHAKLQAGLLRVDPASHIKLTLMDSALAEQGVTLAEPLVLTVTLGDIALPVSPLNLEAATIANLSIHTTPLRFTGEMAKTGYELSSLQGRVIASPLGEKLTLNLEGKAKRNGTADSPIVIQADVRQPLGEHMQAKADVTLSNVAVAVLDAIAKQDGLLLAVLGPELGSLKMAIDSGVAPAAASAPASASEQSPAAWVFNVSAQSTHLNMPGLKGKITPGVAAELSKSQPITLRVTPQGYERLMRPAVEAEAQAESTSVTSSLASQIKGKTGSSISKLLGAILPKASAKDETKAATNDPFVLEGAFDVVLTIDAGKMNLAQPENTSVAKGKVVAAGDVTQPFDLHRVSGALTVEVPQLAYIRKNDGQRVAMNHVKTQVVASKSVADEVAITMTGDTLATPGKQLAAAAASTDAATQIPPAGGVAGVDPSQPVTGTINAKIRLNKLAMLPEGGVDFYHMDSHWQVDVKKMPSQILDELASQQGMLAGMLGGTVDLVLKGDMPGNLDLNLQAPLATVEGLLTVTPQRVVLLRSDLQMQLVATPESVAVMGLLNPQLLALESTRAPIKMVVAKEGFALPLPSPGQALDVTKIQSDLNVELGQVKLRKEGMVKDVFEVLSGFGGLFNKQQVMDVTFTPLDVTMKQGQLKTNDMWLISSDLMMGTQATIDMNRTPAFATIYLGLSGQTLRQLPGARSNIPTDQVVDIKLSAPLTQIKVDHALLIAQLTPLFVSAYGGKDAQKILKGVNQGISILGKITGQQPSAANVSWLNHPQPVAPIDAAVPGSGATSQPVGASVPVIPSTTQPATSSVEKSVDHPKAEPATEPDLEDSVRGLIDLFKKDKKEKK